MKAQELRIYSRLQVVAHQLKKAADRQVLAATGLTTAQIGVMAIIAKEGATHQRHISREMGLNESAVTALITKLGSLGLVVRERSQEDKRAFEVSLTSEGMQQLEASSEPFQTINAKLESALGDRELQRLYDSLQKIEAQFK